MARIVPGAIISDIRGKVGGGIFQKSAQGLSLRSATTPTNTSSQSQMQNRSQLFYLQLAWQQLTEDQRNAWSAWSAYQNLNSGQFVVAQYTGQQSFIQVNRYRTLTGLAVLSDPVFTPYDMPAPVITLARQGSLLFLDLGTDLVHTAYAAIFFVSPPLPPARNCRPAMVRLMQPLTFFSANSWQLEGPYVAAFGKLPPVDNRVWYQLGIQQKSNGALSIFTEGTIVVEIII
jgi:hypothetical protein